MNLRKMVENVLKNNPETRNSDKKLFIEIVKTFYGELIGEYDSILLNDLFQLPNYDTVSRWRRKFQEDGHFMPTDASVIKVRNENKKTIRKELGYDTGKDRAIFDNQQLHHINSISQSYPQDRLI